VHTALSHVRHPYQLGIMDRRAAFPKNGKSKMAGNQEDHKQQQQQRQQLSHAKQSASPGAGSGVSPAPSLVMPERLDSFICVLGDNDHMVLWWWHYYMHCSNSLQCYYSAIVTIMMA
jgi:hypothetical protein